MTETSHKYFFITKRKFYKHYFDIKEKNVSDYVDEQTRSKGASLPKKI